MTDITQESIQGQLKNPCYGRTLCLLDTADSTNRVAKSLGDAGAADGTAVIADTQSAGRGRLGRAFDSPAGAGLYLSLLTYPTLPAESLPLLTVAAAVAARRAIAGLVGQAPDIKWVNDLYFGEKKVAGILCESAFDGTGRPLYSVVGIGINTRRRRFPDELRDIAASIEEAIGVPCDRAALAARLLDSLYEVLPAAQSPAVLAEYRAASSLIGKRVRIVGEGEALYRVTDIDERCALVLMDECGTRRTLATGEVSVRRAD